MAKQLTSISVLSLISTLLNHPRWIELYSKQLLWGMDTLGCLGFLHGKGGVFKQDSPPPQWTSSLWVLFSKDRERSNPEIDWSGGMMSWTEKGRKRKMKVGKWLRKAGATSDQIREFETRKLSKWEWKVSGSLLDILTMSYDRPWTSCMRPDGQYEKGLFSDMRAGSAILFWYRSGATRPCGREVLRPAVLDGKPIILRGGTTYGDGPNPTEVELSERLGIETLYTSLDLRGRGFSLRKDIYSDFDRCSFSQTSKDLEESEEALLKAFASYLTSEPYPYSNFTIPKRKKIKYPSPPSKREVRRLEGQISVLRNSLGGETFSWETLQDEPWWRIGTEAEAIRNRIRKLERERSIIYGEFLTSCEIWEYQLAAITAQQL